MRLASSGPSVDKPATEETDLAGEGTGRLKKLGIGCLEESEAPVDVDQAES